MSHEVKGFEAAFNHGMLYEIGPWFDPDDQETKDGACSTKAQQRKVGYCNVAGDTGGLTKYGIAQNYNKGVDVQNLNLEGAKNVYRDAYWIPSHCDEIHIPIHLFYFDMVINNGLGRAAKILQQAVGAVVDGNIGPVTINKVNGSDAKTVIEAMAKIRTERYRAIVAANSTQEKFLKGWLRRTEEVRVAALALA